MSLSFLVSTAHTSPFSRPGGEDEPDMTLPIRQLGAGDAHSIIITQAAAENHRGRTVPRTREPQRPAQFWMSVLGDSHPQWPIFHSRRPHDPHWKLCVLVLASGCGLMAVSFHGV